jgi:ABC-type nitrate/sulfonate/bicarbonate transport system substrate-binding protein
VDDEKPDAILETLWGRVMEAWDEEKTHHAFLEYAIQAQRLPDAAGRYRALKDDPEKGALAKKKIDAIVIAATSMLMSTKTPERKKVPVSITLSAFAVCLILLGWLFYAMFYAGRR